MVKNPIGEKQFSRLQTSIEWSNRQLNYARKKRIEAIKEYVGKHYMESGSAKIMPTNLLKLAIDIYVRQLAAKSPRVLITTKKRELLPVASNFELAVNEIPKEIGLDNTLRMFVTEAIFSLGVLKIGLYSGSNSILGHSYGKVFVDNVTIDDYFFDMSAKNESLIQYEGNDYWMNYDDAVDLGWIEKSSKKEVPPDDHVVISETGETKAESVSGSNSADTYKDRIWLRDVWLPDEKLILTYGVKSKKLLHTVEWDGPKNGMYVKLGFSSVPGNLMPLPPVAVWRDLNELANALFRKLGNQADSEKSVMGFAGGDDSGVKAFKDARDGDGIKYTGPDPKKLTAGGVNATTLAFFQMVKELSSYFGGNLDSLGGLAPISQTIGQDRLLAEAASAQLRDMASKTADAVREVFYQLAYYEWNDPIKRRMLEKSVPDSDIVIPVEWGPEHRQGEFDVYDLDINVYSGQDDSPSMKLQKLGAIVGQYVLPLAPVIQQAGGTIDVQAIFRDVSKFSNMDEVKDYVTFVDTPEDAPRQSEASSLIPSGGAGESGEGQPQPAASSQSADMINQLMSQSMSQAE